MRIHIPRRVHREIVALGNGPILAAIAWLGKTPLIGVASESTSPRFKRVYDKGLPRFTRHAEMHVSDLLEGRDCGRIYVYRRTATGRLTMARPCRHCRMYMRKAGVTATIYYTNWEGQWRKL